MDYIKVYEKWINDDFIDCVITSPFYNTSKKAGKSGTLKNCNVKQENYHYLRYDDFVDNMPNEEYSDFMVNLFNKIDKKLKQNGCIVFNISYGGENTECMWLTVADILRKTNFTVADDIIWKKKNALPNSVSPNRLTRIVEHVFVFCRKDELKTFKANKKVVSVRKNGQKMYENIYNFIEAKNNDGSCKLNKATYSTELVEKLLDIYVEKGSVVYDCFNGTGTTGVACVKNGINYIGSEISKEQCDYSFERIRKEITNEEVLKWEID